MWTGAAGTSGDGTAVDPEASFGIAGITTSVIAAQTLLLDAHGDLALDDPIAAHLPEGVDFDTNGTTLRDHLIMASGIPDMWASVPQDVLAEDPSRLWTPDEVLATVPASRREPGRFSSSDLSYYLLGLVVADATGMSTAAALRRGALAGDALDALAYQPEEKPRPPLAFGEHSRTGFEGTVDGVIPNPGWASAYGGAGALAGPASAVAAWWWALFAGDVVSAEELDLMVDVDRGGGRGAGHGMGVQRWDVPGLAAHGYAALGAGDETSAIVLALPSAGVVVAVLSTSVGDEERNLGSVADALAAVAVG